MWGYIFSFISLKKITLDVINSSKLILVQSNITSFFFCILIGQVNKENLNVFKVAVLFGAILAKIIKISYT